MARLDLVRTFWIGAATLLCVAALIGITALLSGDFSDTDVSTLASVGIAFLTGSAAVAGFALVERRRLMPLGWVAAALAPVWFGILLASVWGESWGNWSWTALTLAVAELILTTNLLLLRERRFAWLPAASGSALAIATAVTLSSIWSDFGDGAAQAVAVLLILTALGYFLLPVLQRLSLVREPVAGETLVARIEGLDLVAVPAGSEAGGAPFVRGGDGGLTLVRGGRETPLPAGAVLVLRRSRSN